MDPCRVVERFLQARKYTNPTTEVPVFNTDTERVVYVLPETLKEEPGKYKKVPPSKLDTQGKPAPRRPGQPHMPQKPKKPHQPEIPRDPPPAPIHPPVPPKKRLPPKQPKPVPELKPPKVPEPSPPHRWKKVKRILYADDPLKRVVEKYLDQLPDLGV